MVVSLSGLRWVFFRVTGPKWYKAVLKALRNLPEESNEEPEDRKSKERTIFECHMCTSLLTLTPRASQACHPENAKAETDWEPLRNLGSVPSTLK